jgi:ABC-type multidrug transport system fused ATPase/permease subunit
MSEGEIIQEGTHQELVQEPGLYAEMVEREFKEEADVIYDDE